MGNSEKESVSKQIGYEIFVQREAQLEVQSIFDYYEDLNEGLGFEFMRALDATLQMIKRNPLAYQKIYQESKPENWSFTELSKVQVQLTLVVPKLFQTHWIWEFLP